MVQKTHHSRTSNSRPLKTIERHPPEGERKEILLIIQDKTDLPKMELPSFLLQ
jgi:hypothetical protein